MNYFSYKSNFFVKFSTVVSPGLHSSDLYLRVIACMLETSQTGNLINFFFFFVLQNTILRILRQSQNVNTIFIWHAFLNGWREVILALYATRFVLFLNFALVYIINPLLLLYTRSVPHHQFIEILIDKLPPILTIAFHKLSSMVLI